MQAPGARLRWISIKGTRPLDTVDRVVLKLKVSVIETNMNNEYHINSKGLTKILFQGQVTIQTVMNRFQDTIKDIIQDTSMDIIHSNLYILQDTILHIILHTIMDSSTSQAIIKLHLVLVASQHRPMEPRSP